MRIAYADELAIGLAGEHVVCADLISLGHAPFRTEQAAAYDIGVDVGGRIFRLQVKATVQPRQCLQERQRHVVAYTWNLRRGKGSIRAYANGSIDGFALVALDTRQVAYIKPGRQVLQIPFSGSRAKCPRTFANYPFDGLLS